MVNIEDSTTPNLWSVEPNNFSRPQIWLGCSTYVIVHYLNHIFQKYYSFCFVHIYEMTTVTLFQCSLFSKQVSDVVYCTNLDFRFYKRRNTFPREFHRQLSVYAVVGTGNESKLKTKTNSAPCSNYSCNLGVQCVGEWSPVVCVYVQ